MQGERERFTLITALQGLITLNEKARTVYSEGGQKALVHKFRAGQAA
jgi:hypothetical protein